VKWPILSTEKLTIGFLKKRTIGLLMRFFKRPQYVSTDQNVTACAKSNDASSPPTSAQPCVTGVLSPAAIEVLHAATAKKLLIASGEKCEVFLRLWNNWVRMLWRTPAQPEARGTMCVRLEMTRSFNSVLGRAALKCTELWASPKEVERVPATTRAVSGIAHKIIVHLTVGVAEGAHRSADQVVVEFPFPRPASSRRDGKERGVPVVHAPALKVLKVPLGNGEVGALLKASSVKVGSRMDPARLHSIVVNGLKNLLETAVTIEEPPALTAIRVAGGVAPMSRRGRAPPKVDKSCYDRAHRAFDHRPSLLALELP
jgi:hypothetical protein